MTYVGNVHTAATGGIGGAKVYVHDVVADEKSLVLGSLYAQAFTNFNLGFYYQGIGGIWYITPKGNDLYYSTKDTDNMEDLKPFTSSIGGGYSDSVYYIYKK